MVDGWTNNANYLYETWTPGAGSVITQAINNSGGYGIAYKAVASPVGQLMKMVATINISSGSFSEGIGPSNHQQNRPEFFNLKTTTTGIYQTINTTVNSMSHVVVYTFGAIDFSLSNFSYKQVLAPSTIGVTITNTRGGSTYNWVSDTGINPNASSFTVTVSP